MFLVFKTTSGTFYLAETTEDMPVGEPFIILSSVGTREMQSACQNLANYFADQGIE